MATKTGSRTTRVPQPVWPGDQKPAVMNVNAAKDPRLAGAGRRRPLLWFAAMLASWHAASVSAAAGDPAWRFVDPPEGGTFAHAPLRVLATVPTKPDDVVEKVTYRGRRQRYAQIRFGSPGSTRVTVVLDEVGPGESHLYVDANRNRRIEPTDRVAAAGDGRTWHLPLDVAIVDGETTHKARRALVVRRGVTGLTLSAAAAGYLAGTVSIDGRPCPARRVDGNLNGLLTDAQDRLWIDLDGDGNWDPAAEQFLHAPILTLGGRRYAVRSDALGERLALERLEGSATVRLALRRRTGAARVAAVTASLVGRDGSVVGLEGDRPETQVPPGEYRVHTLAITLDDPDGGAPWGFVFSDDGGRSDRGWQQVGRGATVEIDPLGSLEFRPGLGSHVVRPGADCTAEPRLYTAGGLLINTAYRGSPANVAREDGPTAEVRLVTADGHEISSARSGFA